LHFVKYTTMPKIFKMKLNVLKVSFFCITTYLYDELFLENW